jgi:aminoglycoside phosphotransferase (APT) family kinase protein
MAGADVMDLRIWRESDVLSAIQSRVPAAPRLLHASEDPRFQIHAYVEGEVLDQIVPRGRRLPSHVVADACRLLASLGSVPQDDLPPVPADWPADGDVHGFAERLVKLTRLVHRTYRDDFVDLWTQLHIPADPLMVVESSLPDFGTRKFRLVHADVHRKNIIVTGGCSIFLDWELALWGDPVYDLAVHLHKMSYLPDEEERLLTMWAQTAGVDDNWRADLVRYLRHERVKSAIVDSVRYAKLLADDSVAPEVAQGLITRLVAKLNAAYQVWQIDFAATTDSVQVAIESWSRHAS